MMNKRRFELHRSDLLPSVALAAVFCIGTLANAQSAPTQYNPSAEGTDKSVQDNDTTRTELAKFDQFLDSHPEIAEQLRKDPSLANDKNFVAKHPALQTYLQEQPGIREELKENPIAFMREEDSYDRRDDRRDRGTTSAELARFDQFLDGHREIAEQLRKDPSLADNKDYLTKHPELQTFLQDQPAIREDLKENPNAVMLQEDHLDRRDDGREITSDDSRGRDVTGDDRRDRDTTPADVARFDQFLNSHPEIAEQLRKDPSLADNKDFVTRHPALQTYLEEQPAIREDLRENPNAFMRQEDEFARRDDGHDRNVTPGQLAGFREFLSGHSDMAKDLSRNPTLVKDHEYVANHPELQEYLKNHPGAQDEWVKNWQSTAKTSQPPNNNTDDPTKAPTFDSKPKQ